MSETTETPADPLPDPLPEPNADPAPEPDPLAPVLLTPDGPVYFSAPNLIGGLRLPPGEAMRISGSAWNDNDYQVERCDGSGVTVSPYVVDEPAGRSPEPITAHWLPET